MIARRFQFLLLTALIGMATAPFGAFAANASYVAHLHAMNSKVSGQEASGEAHFTVNGDQLTISIDLKGVPPSIEHWQHFHGFKDMRTATCPTAAADKNGDGIIDLIETEPTSGTTMVPFNADPVAMNIPSDTYPTASKDGIYQYRKTVSLKAMTAAFEKAFGQSDLHLDKRVIFIHGVLPATTLSGSVASLGPIPAHVTLPIACGKIERGSK